MANDAPFLTYLPSFKDEKVLLLLVRNEAIRWLIQRLDEPASFLIGDGNPIDSGEEYLVIVDPRAEGDPSITRERHDRFRWSFSRTSADRYKQLLEEMLKTDKACHQYLEADTNDSPAVLVSRDEYKKEMFIRKSV